MLFGLIENAKYDLTNILDGVTLDSDSVSDYRVGGGSLTPIIYHSCYLTMNEPRRKRSRYRSFVGFTHRTFPFIATQASGYVPRH